MKLPHRRFSSSGSRCFLAVSRIDFCNNIGQERPPALQRRLGQGQTCSPDRDRLSIQPWEIADAAERVHSRGSGAQSHGPSRCGRSSRRCRRSGSSPLDRVMMSTNSASFRFSRA
jgi:hypothetical protein